jgi:hypothetical protein
MAGGVLQAVVLGKVVSPFELQPPAAASIRVSVAIAKDLILFKAFLLYLSISYQAGYGKSLPEY